MQVYVKFYATLVQDVLETVQDRYPRGFRAGSPLEVRLPGDSSVSDLLEYLSLSREKVRVIFVNGRARGLDHRLSAGDEVGIFPPIGGG